MKAFFLGLVAALASTTAAVAREPVAPGKWTVDRVVVLMRHGVRPPTKAVPMPVGTATDPWPTWPVKPGYLTPHGAAAIGLVGDYDRTGFVAARLLPAKGCPRPGDVRVIADSDERTIATADAYVAALAPGCTIAIEHRPQDDADPLFDPIDAVGASPIDPATADAAVLSASGAAGITGLDGEQRPILARLDRIYCGTAADACGVSKTPTALVPATARRRPKLSGALDRGSTAAQILLLEYADGKPMAEVGWGRATADDIAKASALHALEFRLLARPHYLASRNMARLAPLIAQMLADDRPDAPTMLMISGHDTNIANLAGLLGIHWSVPGFAPDDPAPGGAIILERSSDGNGHHRVQARYRAQSLDQIRNLTPTRAAKPYDGGSAMTACSIDGQTYCAMDTFAKSLKPAS